MSMTRGLRNAGVVLALVSLPSASALAAQGQGTIVGTVTDAATKKPIADVVVTATAPSLPGEQIVVTDSQGQFRIPQLPAGQYTLRFEKESFRPFSRSDIPLRIDTTVRVNTELLPDTAGSEDIVVVGKAPTIDVGSTNIGTNIGGDFVKNIAVNRPSGRGGATRSFESLAEVAPGTNADDYGVSVAGTTSPENGFVVDGLSVNDPAFGLNGTPLSVEFVQEVNVINGGYMPEYGRSTGGIMNVVTKRGSNEFRGSLFANWAPGSLQSQPTPVASSLSSLSVTNKSWNLGDIGGELGGPIVKDKLWFYVGFDPSFQRNRVTRQLNVLSLSGQTEDDPSTPADERLTATPIDGAVRNRFADQRTFQFIGKLTYAINQDNSLDLAVSGAPSTSGGANAFAIDTQSGGIIGGTYAGTEQALGRTTNSAPIDLTAKLSNAFMDKRLLLDTTLGWHSQTQSELPFDGSRVGSDGAAADVGLLFRNRANGLDDYIQPGDAEYAAVLAACRTTATNDPSTPFFNEANPCPVTSWRGGGAGFITEDQLNRYQGKSVATLIFDALGTHTAKAGVDLEYLTFNRKKAYTGGTYLRQDFSNRYWLEYRNFGSMVGPVDEFDRWTVAGSSPKSYNVGAFLQDSWSIMNAVTLNAGLRYDNQTLVGADGKVGLALPNQFSPRLGLIYDPTQQGRAKLYANYARFFEAVPLNLGDRAFGGEKSAYLYRMAPAWGGNCDPQGNPASANDACVNDSSNLMDLGHYTDPNSFAIVNGADRAMVDPNLKPQSTDEFVVGGEYQVIDNGRFGVFYTKRYMNSVIEDMSRDEASTYFIGNPGEGIAKDFPKAQRDYDAVTLFFNKDFADLWMAQVNYTWSYARGNWAGLYRPETGQLDPNINSDFDLISLLPNRYGPLPGDRTHNFKAFVSKEFVLGGNMSFNVGGTYRARSGTPINVYGAHELYGADEVFLLPRGAGGRTPWRHDVDLRLGYNMKLSDTNVLTVGVDLFNVFNFQQVTAVDETYTLRSVMPVQQPGTTLANLDERITVLEADEATGAPTRAFNPDTSADGDKNARFGKPVGYQAPRNVRFGVRVTF